MFALAIIGLALGAAGTVWSVSKKRDREQQLLWTGGEIRRAITHYQLHGPAGLKQLPRNLEDLVEDRRGPLPVRHLRRAYLDPMTGGEWEMIRGADGVLLGVASRATGVPLKQQGFKDEDHAFENASCYCDWRFVYVPVRPPAAGGQRKPAVGSELPGGVGSSVTFKLPGSSRP
jgi:type II secretory pathway pseudopilin PulG